MPIRPATLADHDQLIALWDLAGLHPSQSDTPDGLARKLERDADLFLVIEEEGILIASVMGSYDGRRGWINRLAIHPDYQNRRLGSLLMAEVEHRLRARGCVKVNLLIERDNNGVQRFYEKLGYTTDDLIFMEKWL